MTIHTYKHAIFYYGPSDTHEMTYFKRMKDIGPDDLCHRAIVSEKVILIPLPVKLITHKQMSRIVKKDDKLTVIFNVDVNRYSLESF